ncbi:MAG: phosphate-starvation-inducible E-like protein [Woeseiaceae bacterium]|nr:phosphate-starvation-inducible E-like protein [Woeseiaceae bacterium]NIP21793.1 phosphate-starvation-inducible E-like protein [Woeseiaceae bacterium]NIS90878.1 phosphate-starvation-inducible E-like protein [Woeseiaceae bacterium]
MEIIGKIERVIAIALLILMGIVVVSGVLEVAYVVLSDLLQPPGFFLGVDDLFDIFGLFLMVLIGLELMTSIKMYLDDNMIHAEIMFLVALTAVARKVVILDAKTIEPMTVFSIAALVIALSGGYYFIKKKNAPGAG